MTNEDVFATILLLVFTPLIFIGVPYVILTGKHRIIGLHSLGRVFQGVETHEDCMPGDVSFVYHTYRGVFLWFIQEEHRVHAQPDVARLLLKRLLWFNLTWGLLSYGLLFVPFLAIGNYYVQLRSIHRQTSRA
jgi:hypothetical protein